MSKDLVKRFHNDEVRDALCEAKVVCISGPRQCGKSTLIKQFADSERRYFDLDRERVRDAIKVDITEFLNSNPMAILDEVHRVPGLLTNIKSSVDETDVMGRYIISSSLSYETLARREDSLAGRLYEINMLPLSLCEIHETSPSFIDLAIDHHGGLLPAFPMIEYSDFYKQAFMGFYPEAVLSPTTRSAKRWAKRYLHQISRLDIKEEGQSKVTPDTVMKALRLLARSTGSVISVQNLTNELEIAYDTTRKILGTLSRLRLISLLSVHSRARKQKKVMFLDTGLLAYLLKANEKNILSIERFKSRGSVFESFVFSELSKQVLIREDEIEIECHRDTHGKEIDFVLTLEDDSIIAIEAKAAGSTKKGDFANIISFARKIGPRFRRGIVLNLGEWSQNISAPGVDSLKGKLWSLPVTSLYSNPLNPTLQSKLPLL